MLKDSDNIIMISNVLSFINGLISAHTSADKNLFLIVELMESQIVQVF